MYGNNANMYGGMMGQQVPGIPTGQMGNQMVGSMGGQFANQPGQQLNQMPNQVANQMTQLGSQQGQQPGVMGALPQQTAGNSMLPGMTGMPGMQGLGMTGMSAGGMPGQPSTVTPGAGNAGMQGMGNTMMGQQGVMGQPGMNQGVNAANWQNMAAQNPQAMATMQAYMYTMRMAALQRLASGAMGAPGFGGVPGAMGSMPMPGMGGPMGMMNGPMGMGHGMGMMANQMALAQQQRAGQQHGGQDGGENSRFWKTRICNKWKDGHCPYGDTCKYAHGDADLRQPGLDGAKGAGVRAKNEVADKRTMIELMRKTRMCDEFIKMGTCKYGDKCTFAHSQSELRQAPNIKEATGQPQVTGGKEMHKTRLCERFMTSNSCPYGDKCTFAHGQHELRLRGAVGTKTQAVQKQQQPQKKQPNQKGDSTAAGNTSVPAAIGVKREREEASGAGEQGSAEDAAKRQHVQGDSAAAAAGATGNETEEQPGDGPDAAGSGDGAWGWQGTQDQQPWSEGDAAPASTDDQQHEQDQEPDYDDGTAADAGDETGAENGDGTAAVGDDAGTGGENDGCENGCRLCGRMVKCGRDAMLASVQQIASPAAQKLGAMILGFGTPNFDQLWHKLSFEQLQTMLSKSDITVADRIELLKTVFFHTHAADEERERLDSQKYVSQGLPPAVADFVAMVLDGKEGSAQMTEYFAALEVCKNLYGVTEEEYFTVSSTMANLFMNM